jgi:hypothetical protein
LESFGELEDLILAKEATLIPNTGEFKANEWFVRFVYRDDAIAAYTDEKMKNVSINLKFFDDSVSNMNTNRRGRLLGPKTSMVRSTILNWTTNRFQ